MTLYRRNRSTELLLIIIVSLFLLYGYYSMQDLRSKLHQKDRETDKTHHYAKLLREQLKVLYKHTGKLEQALKNEKNIHKTTKQELLEKVEEFHLNATKTKHEAINRFNALDTDYKMLKANYEETYQNYAVLQQQHVRLNEAHKNLITTSKAECDRVKFNIENETLHLHSRIQQLYRENMEAHQLAEQYYGYYQDALNQVKLAAETAEKYKDKVQYYAQKSHYAVDQLKSCLKGENVSAQVSTTGLLKNDTEEREDEGGFMSTTGHPKRHDMLVPNNARPMGGRKTIDVFTHKISPLSKPTEQAGELLGGGEDKNANTNEEERERSGANIELNDLLENKPVYMPLSARDNQLKRKQAAIQQENADNKDIREVALENDEELSQSFLTSNSAPA